MSSAYLAQTQRAHKTWHISEYETTGLNALCGVGPMHNVLLFSVIRPGAGTRVCPHCRRIAKKKGLSV